MLFHKSKDESAIGLALVGLIIVVMAAFLGVATGKVQPTAPFEKSEPDVSSPSLHEKTPAEHPTPGNASPYAQPGK